MKKLFFAVVLSFSFSMCAQAASSFSLSQASFDIYYNQGGGIPTSHMLTFTNTTNYNISYRISVPNQPGWLTDGYATTELTAYPGQPTGLGVDVAPEKLAVGTYNTTIYLTGNFTGSPVSIPITLHVQPAGSNIPSSQTHDEGSNVKGPDGTVYLINYGTRNPYTSSGAFLSYGYNSWADVHEANAADMALPIPTCTPVQGAASRPCYVLPRDGSLINDHGTVYIISDGYRQGFVSADVFVGLGYSFSNALSGDTSFLQTLAPINSSAIAHPPGTVINDSGTICVMASPFKNSNQIGTRKCFSNLSDMNTWGFKNSDMVQANSYDRQLKIDGIISVRTKYSPLNP